MDRGAGSYRRYLNGDELAFEEIVKDLRDPLTNFIFGYTRDFHAAEDIAIDVFAYLAANRRYNFKVALKTYLYMLGRSRAIDYLRKRKHQSSADIAPLEVYISESYAPEEELLRDERKKTVHKAIGKLPEKMRTAIILVYFEDMSYEDTARIMKLNKKQVDNLLYRARAELRTIIGEEIL